MKAGRWRHVLAAGTLCLIGCNRAADAPSPVEYRWPEAISWTVEYVAETLGDSGTLARTTEFKKLRLAVRDEDRVAWYDSVLKTNQLRGRPPELAPYTVEDTVQYYLDPGRFGEMPAPRPVCDPALPACAAVVPTTLRLEMRRFIPRLSIWPVPLGGTWADTLAFDERRKVPGLHGQVITGYRSIKDTVIVGRVYWMVAWRSRRILFRDGVSGPALAPEVPMEEQGQVLIDKVTGYPAFAIWSGAVPPPAELRAAGATGTGYRGRAWLFGTPFDSIVEASRAP